MVIFDWMADTVNFTLLGARYLCNSVNILEFHLRMLTTWKRSNPFGSYFWDRTRAMFSIELIILQYWGKTLLSTLTNALWITRFSSSIAGGNTSISSLGLFPHSYLPMKTHLNIQWQPYADLQILFLQGSLLSSTLTNCSCYSPPDF